MKKVRAEGFPPVFDEESRLLILGSFPSVKSRAEGFYYGNRQNRFWRTVCGFFGDEVPETVEGKREFLLKRKIALWDVVTACDIVGSKDDSIENETIADIPSLLSRCPLEAIFLNGSKAFSLFAAHFPNLAGSARKLPSTSPANPRFLSPVWEEALGEIFGKGVDIPPDMV